jgi:tetratricopeptide (TPR) repeat protein
MGNEQSSCETTQHDGGMRERTKSFYTSHGKEGMMTTVRKKDKRPPRLASLSIDTSSSPDISVGKRQYQQTNTSTKDKLDQKVHERSVDGLSLAHSHYNLGVVQWKRGLYQQSLQELHSACTIYAHDDGVSPTRLDLARVYLATGKTYMSLGRRSRSKRNLTRALSVLVVDTSDQEDGSRLLAQVLNSLGQLHEASGDSATALNYFQDAIEMQRQTLGISHVDTAASLLSFGSILERSGDYQGALHVFREAFSIYQEHEASVDMAVTLSNIAWVYYLLGQYEDSLAVNNDSLDGLRIALGPTHRNIASVQLQIGMVYMRQDKVGKAMDAFLSALHIQRLVLGDNHEDVASTLCLSGDAIQLTGRCEKAIQFVAHALEIRRKVFGRKHFLVASTLVQLGNLNYDFGRLAEAGELYNETLRVYEALGIPNESELVRQLEVFVMQLSEFEATDSEENGYMQGEKDCRLDFLTSY